MPHILRRSLCSGVVAFCLLAGAPVWAQTAMEVSWVT